MRPRYNGAAVYRVSQKIAKDILFKMFAFGDSSVWCALIKGSDQPADSGSLIRVSNTLWIAKDPGLGQVDNKDPDEEGWGAGLFNVKINVFKTWSFRISNRMAWRVEQVFTEVLVWNGWGAPFIHTVTSQKHPLPHPNHPLMKLNIKLVLLCMTFDLMCYLTIFRKKCNFDPHSHLLLPLPLQNTHTHIHTLPHQNQNS